jgi:electron transport complex protein RnfB
MVPITGTRTGWHAWSQEQADAARARYHQRLARVAQERSAAKARAQARQATAQSTQSSDPDPERTRKQAIIQAALERARRKKETDNSS